MRRKGYPVNVRSRVQRQTIHDWYAGNFEAEADNARRLARLYGLVQSQRAEGRMPLSARMVKRSLSSGNTLLELLTSDEVQENEIRAVVAQLDQTTSQHRARGAAATRELLGWGSPSEETGASNLDANLEDFADG